MASRYYEFPILVDGIPVGTAVHFGADLVPDPMEPFLVQILEQSFWIASPTGWRHQAHNPETNLFDVYIEVALRPPLIDLPAIPSSND